MTTDSQKFLCLLDELETSHKLICSGFGTLQEIDVSNDFYHLPHQLLASGLERLMKCYISLVYEDKNGSFPSRGEMQDLGHDLDSLLNKICSEFYGGSSRPFVKQEFDYITTDATLIECIRILSHFGRFGRYYNLDVVAGSPKIPIEPKADWESLEASIEDVTPFLNDQESLHRDYYPRVNAKLIAKLERLVRAIALQFTVGDHSDQKGRLRQTSVVFSDFRNLTDEKLGATDYRRSVQILQKDKANWIKRTDEELARSEWPTVEVSKTDFGAEWPFRTDRVTLECRERLFCIVNIEGYSFALNGAAASRFDLPYPHDAGLALLGKSVGPFIEMAFAIKGE